MLSIRMTDISQDKPEHHSLGFDMVRNPAIYVLLSELRHIFPHIFSSANVADEPPTLRRHKMVVSSFRLSAGILYFIPRSLWYPTNDATSCLKQVVLDNCLHRIRRWYRIYIAFASIITTQLFCTKKCGAVI